MVVGGNRFEVVRRGDQFLRHLKILAALLEQDSQKLDQRADTRRRLGLGGDRRRRIGGCETPGDRGQNFFAELPFGYALAEAAGARQRLDRSEEHTLNSSHIPLSRMPSSA